MASVQPKITIAELRARNGKMTQQEFAESIGVSPQTVSSWEKNIYSIRPVHLLKVCERYNVTSKELLGA
ncbi:helix-turn-helix transcriptional regulator [Aerococcaceae bacterium NML160702]|nr:helix-turn-helix transcriptional regulator [Aerococcaceae bacterium NML160702]